MVTKDEELGLRAWDGEAGTGAPGMEGDHLRAALLYMTVNAGGQCDQFIQFRR